MAKTKAPTGLTITRKGTKFICEWKISDADYKDGIDFEKRLSWGRLISGGIISEYSMANARLGGTTTKRVLELDASDWFPTTKKCLSEVRFGVKGNRKSYTKKNKTIDPSWSDMAYKAFAVKAPPKPKIATAWVQENRTTYTATVSGTDNANHSPFTRLKWETILVKNASTTDGSAFNWNSSAQGWDSGTSGNTTYAVPIGSESITPTRATSWTRFVRVRSEGIGGASDWAYAYHVYGVPLEPSAVKPTVGTKSPAGDITLDLTFATPSNAAHPIDYNGVILEYIIATPAAGITVPSGASYTEAGARNNTKANDRFYYDLGTNLPLDNCLWYRVKVKHDNYAEPSETYLRYVGELSQPTDIEYEINWTTRKVEVSATNNSEVPDSFLVVVCSYSFARGADGEAEIGVITSGSGIFDLPPDAEQGSTGIGVYAAVGQWTGTAVKPFSGKPIMRSAGIVWGDDQPHPAPAGFTVTKAPIEDTAELSWQWTWEDADVALITWSDNPVAWESNDEPSEYLVKSLYAGHWYISDIEEGKTWYFRMRLGKTDGDDVKYGDWTDIVDLDLRSAPNKPTLVLSDEVITEDGMTTAYWAYVTTDGTPQNLAQICEAFYSGNTISYGEPFDEVDTEQHIDVYAKERGWAEGEDHYLCVRVRSESGITSEGWSDPVAVHVAAKPQAVISSTSLISVPDGDGGTTLGLASLPLNVTVTGAGAGTTTVAIERADDYVVIRPDDSTVTGHAGETVALMSQDGEAQMSITPTGYLDDGAKYTIVATVKDAYGQTDTARQDFIVRWAHQAAMPNGEVYLDGLVAVIVPRVPTDVPDGWVIDANDTCDIYRLSADKPELIYPNAEFGVAYVDPYPAIGGGYRFVFKTKYGDYIISDTEGMDVDGQLAMVDIESGFTHDRMIIDFNGDTVELYYNIDEDDDWSKDFVATTYLGGTIVGDWNPAVEHTADINAVVITVNDDGVVDALRSLAEYAGAVHVRTKSGGSYTANVDVKRTKSHEHFGTRYSYSLSITKIDSQGYDGVKYTDYDGRLGYLVDEDGNNILDEDGNFIVAYGGD